MKDVIVQDVDFAITVRGSVNASRVTLEIVASSRLFWDEFHKINHKEIKDVVVLMFINQEKDNLRYI